MSHQQKGGSPVQDVLFLGTGIMGAPMARHISAAGYNVTAWNRTPQKSEALKAFSITPLHSLASLEQARRVVILMVSTGNVCDDLLFGASPVAAKLAPGSVVIVMSSVPVETARSQAVRLSALGIGYIDAPVSGGERGAQAAALSIMAGGTDEAIQSVRPVLSTMGRVHHVGPAGCGQLAKLANQTIVGISIGAVAEALLIAKAGGADLDSVREALMGGFANSEVLRQHGERMIKGDFAPGAYAHIQLKDVTTAQALASSLGVSTPLLGQTCRLYSDLCETPLRNLDHSVLYQFLEVKAESA